MDKLYLNSLRLDKSGIDTTGEDVIRIKGYGCHFNTVNKNHEIVTEESFTKFFDELKQNGLMPALTFNHQTDLLIGAWDSISADENGLICEGHIYTEIDIVKNRLLPLIKNGELCSLSTEGYCAFDKMEYDHTADALRLNEFVLTAVSLVSVPADLGASIELANELSLRREQHNKDQHRESAQEGIKSFRII